MFIELAEANVFGVNLFRGIYHHHVASVRQLLQVVAFFNDHLVFQYIPVYNLPVLIVDVQTF